MHHSPPACCPPFAAMHASLSNGDRNSIASTSASSTISILSCAQSGSKLRDKTTKREQNPRYGHDNGLDYVVKKGKSRVVRYCVERHKYMHAVAAVAVKELPSQGL